MKSTFEEFLEKINKLDSKELMAMHIAATMELSKRFDAGTINLYDLKPCKQCQAPTKRPIDVMCNCNYLEVTRKQPYRERRGLLDNVKCEACNHTITRGETAIEAWTMLNNVFYHEACMTEKEREKIIRIGDKNG